MKKDFLTPNSICKLTLDEFATVTIRVDAFVNIHYQYNDDGSIVFIVEPLKDDK